MIRNNRHKYWYQQCAKSYKFLEARTIMKRKNVNLHNREMIGYSVGPKKVTKLVQHAFETVHYNLTNLEIFHTGRGSEFKNQLQSA